MRNKVIIPIVLLGFLSYCCHHEQRFQSQHIEAADIPGSKITVPVNETSYTEATDTNHYLYTIPKKLDIESERFVDQNDILHIIIGNACLNYTKQSEILKQFFPNAKLQAHSKNEVYSAYDIKIDNENYNVLIVYENNGKETILSQFFIGEGKFTIQMLEKLLS